MKKFMSDTNHIRQPERSTAPFRSLSVAIERASTVVFDDLDSFEQRGANLYDGFSYGLYGTPTSRVLEDHIAELEGGTRALLTPSGLSAIVVATMACAVAGDRVLLPDSVYGPAKDMALGILAPLGVEVCIYNPLVGGGIGEILTDQTRLVWVESPGSLSFEAQDVPAIVRAAHARGIRVAADNTWASHLFFRPLEHGVDISMQALSKHASGHGDLLLGSVAVRDVELFRRLKDVARLMGYGVSPDDCALCERGLKTMPVRMRHSAMTAATLIEWLKAQPSVAQILHPAQPGHPGHDIWKRDFSGAPGVFGIVFKHFPRDFQAAALAQLKVFRIGASWGGVQSLVAPSVPRKGRSFSNGIVDGPYWRMSIGLEDCSDLINDLSLALSVFDQVNGSPAANAFGGSAE